MSAPKKSFLIDTDPVVAWVLLVEALVLYTVIYPYIAEALYRMNGGLNALQIVYIVTVLPCSFISLLAILGLYKSFMPRAKVPCLINQFL
jgi:choline-glycine betaine transporter